ncbi:MAG: hypothetical protein ABFR75_06050 [Acidobacteriota bacterium]
MIRQNIKISFLIIMLIAFQSCFDLGLYISEVPLGSPTGQKPDKDLIGIWERISDKSTPDDSGSIEFTLFNEHEYVIRVHGGNEKNLARAFIVKVGKFFFLNIQELSENERKFVFCSYKISDSKDLVLNFVSDSLFKEYEPKSSRKLFKFIRKNLDNPELFDKETKILLVKKEN